MPYSERRRFPRFPFHSQGVVNIGEQAHQGMVLDVSLKGALFNADNVFVAAPLHMCSLDLFHAGQPGFCTATALVSYQRGSLVGLEFVNLSDAARKLLTQVVEMNLAVDTLLERDLSEMLDTPGRC